MWNNNDENSGNNRGAQTKGLMGRELMAKRPSHTDSDRVRIVQK